MAIKYKIDVLKALKDSGYNTNKLRTEKLLDERTIQSLRTGRVVNASNLSKICKLLHCQPGDILEYVEDE